MTLFCNCSEETLCVGSPAGANFGHSAVLIHKNHKLRSIDMEEYSSDDFDGRPVCRLRFGAATRLYYFSLPFFHELDPRATRTPIKVHAIFRSGQKERIRINSDKIASDTKALEVPVPKKLSTKSIH